MRVTEAVYPSGAGLIDDPRLPPGPTQDAVTGDELCGGRGAGGEVPPLRRVAPAEQGWGDALGGLWGKRVGLEEQRLLRGTGFTFCPRPPSTIWGRLKP
jgi:hypothetical protein